MMLPPAPLRFRMCLWRIRLLHESAELTIVLKHRSRCSIVITKEADCLSHPTEAQLQVRLRNDEGGMGLLPNTIHLSLATRERCEFSLERLHVLLQLSRLGGSPVDSRRHFRDVCFKLTFFRLCLGQLFVAVRLLGRITTSLLFQSSYHVRNETLHLGKRISTSRSEAK